MPAHTIVIGHEQTLRERATIDIEASEGATSEEIAALAIDELDRRIEAGTVSWGKDEVIDGSAHMIETIDGREVPPTQGHHAERDLLDEIADFIRYEPGNTESFADAMAALNSIIADARRVMGFPAISAREREAYGDDWAGPALRLEREGAPDTARPEEPMPTFNVRFEARAAINMEMVIAADTPEAAKADAERLWDEKDVTGRLSAIMGIGQTDRERFGGAVGLLITYADVSPDEHGFQVIGVHAEGQAGRVERSDQQETAA
jgi:hypothetical protein